MSGKRYDIEQLKTDYIGKTFEYFTVIDAIKNDNNIACFVCRCKCGNVKTIDVKRIFNGSVKSCGCKPSYKYDADKLKEQYIGATSHFLTVTDVYRNEQDKRIHLICKCRCGNQTDVTLKLFNSGKAYSCGCYKSSEEYKSNTSAAQIKYHKEHPEAATKMSELKKQYYKDHPEKAKEISVRLKSNNYNLGEKHIARRAGISLEIDLSIIHPDDRKVVLDGVISSTKVRSKCPRCMRYDYHILYHIINYAEKRIMPRLCYKCNKSFSSSKYEDEIAEFVSSFYTGELLRNDRSVLDGKELDLYYPKEKIAIEFNGDYWHNEDHKPKCYHLNKYLQCKEKGILLVSIFESEWLSKKHEIQTYLINLFNHIDDDLSFISDKSKMNNNYPAPNSVNKQLKIEESSYTVKDTKIDMCGYSILEN